MALPRVLVPAWIILLLGFWPFFVMALIASYGIYDWVGYDYASFWAAGRAILQNGPAAAYDLDTLARLAQPLAQYLGPQSSGLAVAPGLYPPPFFLLLSPFALLPGLPSLILWTVFQASLALYVTYRLAARFPFNRVLVSLATFLFFPLSLSLLFGQSTMLPLVALYQSYCDFERGREFRAGLWLGVLFIKPQYAILFPLVLIYKRRWRALAGLLAVVVPLGLVSLALLGSDGIANYQHLSSLYGGFQHTYPSVHPYDMINWRGLLIVLFPSLSETTGQALTLALSVLTAGFLLLIWRGEWNTSGVRFSVQMLATMLIVLITAYHSHIHGVTLLIVPAMALVAKSAGLRALCRTIYVGLFALPLVFAGFLVLSSLTEAWHNVTRTLIAFIFVLFAICVRESLRVMDRDGQGHPPDGLPR